MTPHLESPETISRDDIFRAPPLKFAAPHRRFAPGAGLGGQGSATAPPRRLSSTPLAREWHGQARSSIILGLS